MNLSRYFTLRLFLTLIAIVGVLWFSPEKLYSQTGRVSTSPQKTTVPPATSPTTTSTTPPAPAPQKTQTPPTPKTSPTPEQEKSPAEQLFKGRFDSFKRPSLITQAIVLSFLSLMPFIVMMMTSFLKIVVVLSLLRSALGAQQAPPNAIINGVAFMLSLFIMYPTGIKMYDASRATINELKTPDSLIAPESSTYIIAITESAREPLREFFKNNSSVKHQALFYRLAYTKLPEEFRPELKVDDFMVLVPSFITSQLKDAFEIGVLIYVPFFVIDLVTSNVLLAMGMMMLSPVTISMPLKLFLLVMLDGWTLLIEGLVHTFF